METKQIDTWLDFLYYEIGKQVTDFYLQQQEKDGFMSKRRKYSEIGFEKNRYWLPKVNARTIMINEVVLDIDPMKDESEEDFKERIQKVQKDVMVEKPDYWGIFNSNHGIHIHQWFNRMFYWNVEKRKQFRLFCCKKYGADLQKISENVCIALGFARHWKSNKIKTMIRGNLDGYNAGI